MDSIFINLKITKTFDPHRLLLNLVDKLILTRSRWQLKCLRSQSTSRLKRKPK